MSSTIEFVPACKPLRLIEYSALILCFLLLFFLRNYVKYPEVIISARDLILLFVSYGSLLVLTGSDIVAQFLRKPTPNKPMFIIALIGAVFCSFSGFSLVYIYQTHEMADAKRSLRIIIAICGCSFFAAVAYAMDSIIIQRFS